MEYIISAIIAISILFSFLFITLKGAVKRITQNAKKYFLEKMQSYNYLVDEKQQKLSEMQEQIDMLEEKYKKYTKIDEKLKKIEDIYKKMREDRAVKPKVEFIQTPQYRDNEFFKDYKNLKQKFDINGEKALKDFMKEHPIDDKNKEYIIFKDILSKFTTDYIYKIVTTNNSERYEKVDKILTNKEKKLIDFSSYKNTKFDILKLVNDIKEKMSYVDPTIYVYTSKVGVNYDYLDDRICTKTYTNMSEGIIIEYQNKLYDYSI